VRALRAMLLHSFKLEPEGEEEALNDFPPYL